MTIKGIKAFENLLKLQVSCRSKMRITDIVAVIVVCVVATSLVGADTTDSLVSTEAGGDSCEADSGAVSCNAKGSTPALDKV